MSGYIYDPVQGTVNYKDQTVQFYCGPELSDMAIILLEFHFGLSDLQNTAIRLFTVNGQNKTKDYELTGEIKRQISHILNGGHDGKVTIQDANRLIKLMGGDIVFGIENCEMVNYYLILLLTQKVLL